jgi:hypothetical protein
LESSKNQVLSDLEVSSNIDQCWDLVKTWIDHAISQSCGKYFYRTTSYKEFFDHNLKIIKQLFVDAEAAYVVIASTKNIPGIKAAKIQLATTRSNYRKAIKNRKSVVFHEMANRLSEQQKRL